MVKKIETDKFTENLLVFYQFLELDKIDITALHLLLYTLRSQTRNYPSLDLLRKKSMELYDVKCGWSYAGYGRNLMLTFRVNYIANQYLEDPEYINELKKLIVECLKEPLIDLKGLEQARKLFINHWTMQQENPNHLAMRNALKGIENNQALAIDLFGDPEAAQNITVQDLQQLYDQISSNGFRIISVGKIEPEMEKMIIELEGEPPVLKGGEKLEKQEVRFFESKMDITQTSLFQIYRLDRNAYDEDYFALILGNAILGNSQNSLLFEEVREKHSLCYGISSSLVLLDGALFIKAEILPGSQNKACAVINEQIERLQKGDYPDSLLERAKKEVTGQLRLKRDSLSAMAEHEIRYEYLEKNLTIEDIVREIEKVSKSDIAKAYSQISLVSQAIIEPEEIKYEKE